MGVGVAVGAGVGVAVPAGVGVAVVAGVGVAVGRGVAVGVGVGVFFFSWPGGVVPGAAKIIDAAIKLPAKAMEVPTKRRFEILEKVFT